MRTNEQHNSIFLNTLTNNHSVIGELLCYTKNKFSSRKIIDESLEKEEPYISTWNTYKTESKKIGVFEMLKSKFKQFQFPIQKNISLQQDYRNATLKGATTNNIPLATGLVLNEPKALKIEVYQSIAGKVPVLTVPNNDDFNSLIQAFSYKNEPVKIPYSMGAALINGINNWDRIDTLKKEWQQANPFENWNIYFKEYIAPNPSLYKDKLIILSTKPYSGVSANSLNISSQDWSAYSLTIRLEHECTHLFTLKHYGHMANNMHDELIADYMGISKALNKFNSNWFSNFIGLENFPEYRLGARLENYLGNPPLSKEAFNILKIIIKNATDNIAAFDNYLGKTQSSEDQIRRLESICSLDLIEIAADKEGQRLLSSYQKNAPKISQTIDLA